MLPYSSRVFGLPHTHTIEHETAVDEEHIEFHVWALSFFLGMRLTTTEAGDGASTINRALLRSYCRQQWHNAFMSVQLTIRGVPEKVRDELASRAALQRQSMQEFLRGELERIAARPSPEQWLNAVRDRKEAAGTRVTPYSIVRARDADRE